MKPDAANATGATKKVFQNPPGYWEHKGKYSVELTPQATTDHLPPSAKVGLTVTVPEGRIKQVIGGIQFYSNGEPFSWGYRYIKSIKDEKGNLIWQNYDHKVDTAFFQNPSGYWEHEGIYVVELTPSAVVDYVPTSAEVKKTVTVENGTVKQVMGGIQFHSASQPFSWGYKFIKAINDGNGEPVWQNSNYNK